MRTSKLIGALLLTGGIFILTRGTGAHVGSVVLGTFVALTGALLLSRGKVQRVRVKRAKRRAPRALGARPGRARRMLPAAAKSAGR